jgi:hypothetical protein
MTEEWVAKFLRGLTIGALIGAVIAGSRVWTRWGLRLPPRVAGLLPGRSSDPVGANVTSRGDQGLHPPTP